VSNISQFPSKEVKDYEDQLHTIQAELHADAPTHEGKTAEEVYAERLALIQLADDVQQDGETVARSLLARCLLWVEIIQEKYALSDKSFLKCTTDTIPLGMAKSTIALRSCLTSFSRSRLLWNT
jgi:hypothetical protein